MVFLKEFVLKDDFVKNQQMAKKEKKYPVGKEFTLFNLGPDLDPNCLTLIVYLKEFIKKDDLKKTADCKKEKRNTQ